MSVGACPQPWAVHISNRAFLFLALAVALPNQAIADELAGSARFCGYSPIIDLFEGEKITTLDGGIHSGSFRWEGPFGSLDVSGLGWAGRPDGRIVEAQTDAKPARFAQRRVEGRYVVAIWNGAQAQHTSVQVRH